MVSLQHIDKEEKMILWNKYFDRIFCVFHLPNQNRMPRLCKELQRVGISDSGIFEWRFTTKSHWDEVVLENQRKNIDQVGYVNQAQEMLKILSESAELGYDRILVIEDDIAFLRNLNELEEMLKGIPKEYDFVQLDKGIYKHRINEWERVKNNRVNQYFADGTGHQFGTSTASVFSKSGIAKCRDILNYRICGCDQFPKFGEISYCIAIRNLCIQVFFHGMANEKYGGIMKCHELYKTQGIKYEDYAVPVPYEYDSFYRPIDEGQCGNAFRMFNEENKPLVVDTQISDSEKKGWAKFDYIGVVCYTGYKKRAIEIMEELKRIGIGGIVNIHWDVPSMFRDRLFNAVGKTKYCSEGGCFFMSVMHYNVIKTAYELGCNNVLVMEDDIRFLKNKKMIERILDSIPEGYDMLMLDKSKPGEQSIAEWSQNTYTGECKWVELKSATSTGCYAFSRRGMHHYLDIFEDDIKGNLVRNPDYYFRQSINGKTYWGDGYRRYFCLPNLAVQTVCGDGNSHCSMQAYWENNERIGVKQEFYNLSYPVITRTNFLELLYAKIEKQDRFITSGLFYVPTENEAIANGIRRECTKTFTVGKVAGCTVWGNGASPVNISALQVAYKDNAQVVLCEDGFIRSIDTWCGDSNPIYKQNYSIVIDTRGYYFDATRISTIEQMLNNFNLLITPEQRVEARRLIDKIVSNKISKYNHQPIITPKIGREGVCKVLVVDQSYGDFSIKLGMADDSTFEKMLQTAIDENPDADILVKTHPDTLAGKKAEKKGYYQDLKEHDNIYKVTFPINPYSLLEVCDKVYVCSSQFGLEALMAGKEVHVFGMPFYAGWGLTIDDQHLDRRTNMRTLEELFYIFYCLYTHWVDPDKGCETTIDAVIDKMIALREEYQKNPKKYTTTTSSISPTIRKGYNLYRKPLLPRANKPIVIPPRYGANTTKSRVF